MARRRPVTPRIRHQYVERFAANVLPINREAQREIFRLAGTNAQHLGGASI
jgi:hypothetical protein